MSDSPPSQPLVVASMIVKNEADNLPGVFASAMGLVDVWTIVDTGSTDDTVEVAVKLGREHNVPVHIIEDEWDDDFARSRNVGLDFIDGLLPDDGLDPWILILDGDDRLQAPTELRGLLAEDKPDMDCILLRVVSETGAGGVESILQPRLFRRGAGIRYKYPVHLTADFGVEHRIGSFEDTPIRHLGYAEGGAERNAERTLRIVHSKMEPGDPHRTYVETRALVTLGRADEAAQTARRGIALHHATRRNDGDPEGLLTNASPWRILALVMLSKGDDVAALRVLADGLSQGEEFDASPDVWYAALQVAATGLYARALALALGAPGLSSILANVPQVLNGLIDAGVLASGLDLGPLREHAAKLRGVGSKPWEGGWPAKAPGTAKGTASVPAPAAYYDEVYAGSAQYHADPDPTLHGGWFKAWDWAASRIDVTLDRVLDLGCGPGHLAALLIERGLPPEDYLGVDFSEVAIEQAQARVPGAAFRQTELPDSLSELIKEFQPTVITALEVVEHVSDEVEAALLGTGVPTLITVPRCDDASHLRYFPTQESAEARYKQAVEPVGQVHWGFESTGCAPVRKPAKILVVAQQDTAGQASGIVRALREHTDLEVAFLLYRNHPFGYPLPSGSVVVEDGGAGVVDMARSLAEGADFIHFLLPPEDLPGLRWADYAHAENALVQYMGSVLRHGRAGIVRWHEHTGILGLSAWDQTMLDGSPMPYHVPLVLASLDDDGPSVRCPLWPGDGGPFRIAHATTNRTFKGTQTFLDAVAGLHDVEAVIIEDVSNAECMAVKATCHAYFDQFSVGIYGMSAAESMAIGQPVLTGTSAWARSVQPDMPVIDVTPKTLVREIERLRMDRGAWGQASMRSFRWARYTHAPEIIARRLRSLYDYAATER